MILTDERSWNLCLLDPSQKTVLSQLNLSPTDRYYESHMPGIKLIYSHLKTLILLLCISFTCSCILLAGNREGYGRGEHGSFPGEMPLPQRINDFRLKSEHLFNMMCDSLALDKQQKKEARRLHDEMIRNKEEMARIFRGGYLDIDILAEKVTEINMYYYEQISALLNEKQREKFVSMKKN